MGLSSKPPLPEFLESSLKQVVAACSPNQKRKCWLMASAEFFSTSECSLVSCRSRNLLLKLAHSRGSHHRRKGCGIHRFRLLSQWRRAKQSVRFRTYWVRLWPRSCPLMTVARSLTSVAQRWRAWLGDGGRGTSGCLHAFSPSALAVVAHPWPFDTPWPPGAPGHRRIVGPGCGARPGAPQQSRRELRSPARQGGLRVLSP